MPENNNGEIDGTLLNLEETVSNKHIQKQNIPNSLIEFYAGNDTARTNAIATLLTGKVPKYAVREHPGNGGKIFKYVDHVWVTQLLREAFGPFWGSEVLESTIEEDGTATARVKITIKIPKPDGSYHEIVFIELGACNTTSGMTMANRRLSAGSKGLVRCAFRAFGLGQEFYNTTDYKDWSNDDAWDAIVKQIKKNKKYITEEMVVEFCKQNNIKNTQISERFEEIWTFVGLSIISGKNKEK